MNSSADTLKNEGNARKAAGDLRGAVERYRRALEVQPGHPAALYNLGVALRELEEFDEAEACFRMLLEREPRDPEALFNLGVLQQRGGRLAEAEQTYRLALEISSQDAHLWMRLGVIRLAQQTAQGREEAASCFERSAALAPDSFESHFNQGLACAQLRRYEEAVRAFARALELNPDHPAAQANLLHHMQHICDWSRFDELSERRRRNALLPDAAEPPLEPFDLVSIDATPAEQLAQARAHARRIEARATENGALAPHRNDQRRATVGRAGKLRIGYLSSDFHEHVTAHCMVELFELHDRARFETIAYSTGPDDGSAMRARLGRAFNRFVDLRHASIGDAARRIHADGIDILVDLKGYTAESRAEILALRPAPLQAGYMGYPATTGANFIDYLITDRFVVPPEQRNFYSEQPAYVPGCYFASDRGRPILAPPPRAELGLPQDGFVFCCFNQPYKITPRVFKLWMRLLRAQPDAVLWLLQTNQQAPDNLRNEARRLGVDPARLVFAPASDPQEYLRRMGAADLFLDTLPCNAHTTASDALWVGLPVLTCAGQTFASRVAGSQLSALELPELVTHSLEDYEELALRLARDSAMLSALRETLRLNKQTARLFDTAALARELGRVYEEMWAICGSGAPPRPIGA